MSCSKALVKFRTNDRSGDGIGSFKVKIRANAEKFTNMITARFRERSDIWSEKVSVHQR